MGYVTSIHFNKNDFPLSPCMDSYGIYDSPDAFIIEANGDHSLLDVFEVSVGADVTAKTLTLGGEAYSIRVYREGSDLDPVICFGMVNEETQEEEKTFKMQQLEFLTSYAADYQLWLAQKRAEGHGVEAPMEHWSSKLIEAATDFETAWSAQWVQMNVFGEEIQAESKFWRKFMGDLDVALAPINAKMELLSRGIADKPWRIEEGLHIPQSEQ